jgi:hypothetical protein
VYLDRFPGTVERPYSFCESSFSAIPRQDQKNHFFSLSDERKSGLTKRLNFSGSAFSSSRLKRSSLSRVFSLIGFGGFDLVLSGTPEA